MHGVISFGFRILLWNAATELQPLAGSTDKNGTQVCSAPGDETYLGYEQSESEIVHHSTPTRFLQDGSSLLFPLFLSEVEAVTVRDLTIYRSVNILIFIKNSHKLVQEITLST